jgi:DNA replication and repair protein RecF
MQLQHLSLDQFRNFARLDADLPETSLIIQGRNAQGKTSILEAIYFLATLSSFHAENDRQLVNFIEARKPLGVARIKADFTTSIQKHQLEIRIIKEKTKNGVDRARKEILLDGSRKKISEAIGNFNAVLFLPQMLQIVEGSPGFRRRYLDQALSQSDRKYSSTLSDYEQILSQRNALLKQLNETGGNPAQLDFWDERLSQRGAEILHMRFQALAEMDQIASRLHLELTEDRDSLLLNYQPSFDPLDKPTNQPELVIAPTDRSSINLETIQSGFHEALLRVRPEHIARGITSLGPHRDDFRFIAAGVDVGSFGSRGQMRTALLALKFAEMQWIKFRTGHQPVLLLDEVLAELDQQRRQDLLTRLAQNGQVLLTTTDLNLFEASFTQNAEIWHVDGGQLSQ